MHRTLSTFSFLLLVFVCATASHAHEMTGDDACHAFEQKLYGKSDGISFGDAVKTYRGLSYYHPDVAAHAFWDQFQEWQTGEGKLTTTPLVAKILPCISTEPPKVEYAEDTSYCLVPEIEEVRTMEYWVELLEQNQIRKEFREICPAVYSEEEKKLFLLSQKADGNYDEDRTRSLIASKIISNFERQCYRDEITNPASEAFAVQKEWGDAGEPNCIVSFMNDEPGFCEKYESDDPRDRLRNRCAEDAKQDPMVQSLWRLYVGSVD